MTSVVKMEDERENILERRVDYLSQTEEEKAFYESFLQDAQDAWEAYQKDGLHLTLDEVRQWLITWGTENEGPAPECHK